MSTAAPLMISDATLRELNDLSRRSGTVALFQDTYCRFDGTNWWVMHKSSEGWESYGRRYETLSEIAARYLVRFVGTGRDRFGDYVVIEPL